MNVLALIGTMLLPSCGGSRALEPSPVASVVVSPAVYVTALGDSAHFSARPLDAAGTAVPGQIISWRASDPAIVRVRSDGTVLALTRGFAQVIATVATVSGQGTIQSVERGWPDEPAGYQTLNDNPWDALASHGWDHANRAAFSRIVPDSSSPISPPNVLEQYYPAGYTSRGAEPAVDWYDVAGRRSLFVGFWWKPSNPWQGHASNINKILFIWNAAHTASIVFAMYGHPGGPYHVRAMQQGEPDGRTQYMQGNVHVSPVVLGKWHRLEVQVINGGPGAGVIRWWQDGTLIGSFTDFNFTSDGWGQVEIAPTWGGIGGTNKTENDYFRYDDTHISAPPGGGT